MAARKYSIGSQTFEKLITENRVYVDKTELIYNLAQYSCIFLSRPRRFGKSLLCSTLKSYFEGRKDLFKGLAMEKLETEWVEYPVIHISFAANKNESVVGIDELLNQRLEEYEKKYNIENKSISYSRRFEKIVKTAFEQTGRKVVVILDEYDAQMLNTIDNDELQAKVREKMNDLFSPLKDLDPKLRFVFVTGISQFVQQMMFSTVNNFFNISDDERYNNICGISKEEMTTTLKEDLEMFAESNGISYEQALNKFYEHYNGYRFSTANQEVLNPYSVFYALDKKIIKNYWDTDELPSPFVTLIKRYGIDVPHYDNIRCGYQRFSDTIGNSPYFVPLLYRTGFITIKNYNERREMFTLGFPNKEVKMSFATNLMKYAYNIDEDTNDYMANAYKDLKQYGDIAGFMKFLNLFYRKFPFSLNNKNEKHYHSILYTMLASYGADVIANPESAKGKADLLLRFEDVNYIFELKLDGKTRYALEQIYDMDYVAVAIEPGKKIVKLAINFSTTDRCILDWDVDDGFEF